MGDFFTRIGAFFTAVVVAIGGFFCSFKPEIPAGKSAAELENMSPVFEHYELGDEIYAIEIGNISEAERNTVICLQGLVNRVSPRLYVIYDSVYRSYLNDLEKAGKKIIRTDKEGKAWVLSSLVEQFRDCITDGGYSLYKESPFAEGLNTACNLATAEGWLAFREDKKELAESLGLTLKADLSKEEYNYAFQRKYFDKYQSVFNRNAVAHLNIQVNGMRDFAIQQGLFICYSGNDAGGKSLMRHVLKKMEPNCIVLGWGETEKHFVAFLSKLGCSIIPADHSRDNSVLAHIDAGELKQKRSGKALPTDPAKHYAAIVFSDGDNSQWVQGGFSEFYRKLKLENDFTMTWTLPPLQNELSPDSTRQIYAAATENNCFISGVSGAGYMNPSIYKESCLPGYADMTAAAMLKSDMKVIGILDDKPSAIKQADFERRFDYFSRYETVRGGIVMLDPGRYESGKGAVWFSNGKPFVSVRLSLWYPEGEGSAVTPEWIEEQAAKVNRFEANINSVDGYSVINVHPWSVSVDNLAYFVSLLDDGVELVTAETLIEMITENVKQ